MLISRKVWFQLLIVLAVTVILWPQNAMAAIRVDSNVQAAKLIKQTKPVYPQLAKASRAQGTVKMEILISTTGMVKNIDVISGPALLIPSATTAVSTWQYRPTLINGNPVEVLTTVAILFTLSQ